jgi:transposase
MAKKRRTFSREFKTKIALEALKEQLTISQLAQKHNLHPNTGECLEEASKGILTRSFRDRAANR